MKFTWSTLWLLLAGCTVLSISACDKDDDGEPSNEEELITTVTLRFTNQANSELISAVWQDLDGPGGNAPTIDTIRLSAAAVYNMSPSFSDDSRTPAEDITAEVAEEDTEHLVCWEASGAMSVPSVTDTDSTGAPLGLLNAVIIGSAGSGSLTLRLKHEPDKAAANPCNTGETDVEVRYPVIIE